MPQLVKLNRAKAGTERLRAEGKPVTGAAVASMLGTTDRTGRSYLAKVNAVWRRTSTAYAFNGRRRFFVLGWLFAA